MFAGGVENVYIRTLLTRGGSEDSKNEAKYPQLSSVRCATTFGRKSSDESQFGATVGSSGSRGSFSTVDSSEV
jgi:hypothetical protein